MSNRFVIVLEPLPDRTGDIRVPVENRLRQLLKLAGRGFKLRVVDVRRETGGQGQRETRSKEAE